SLYTILYCHRNTDSRTFVGSLYPILSTIRSLDDILRFTLSHFVHDTLAGGQSTMLSFSFCQRDASSRTFRASLYPILSSKRMLKSIERREVYHFVSQMHPQEHFEMHYNTFCHCHAHSRGCFVSHLPSVSYIGCVESLDR